MTTPAERLAAAIHMESAAIAPQTSPLIEAAKEVLKANERMRAALTEVVKWADDLRYFSEPGSELAPVFLKARDAIIQQLTPQNITTASIETTGGFVVLPDGTVDRNPVK